MGCCWNILTFFQQIIPKTSFLFYFTLYSIILTDIIFFIPFSKQFTNIQSNKMNLISNMSHLLAISRFSQNLKNLNLSIVHLHHLISYLSMKSDAILIALCY